MIKWNTSNKPKPKFEHSKPNFYTPLTSQVEALATPLESINSLLGKPTTPSTNPVRPPPCLSALSTKPRRPNRQLSFTLPLDHVDKSSKAWRRSPRSRSQTSTFWSNAKHTSATGPQQVSLTKHQLKQGVLDGSIPSAAWDTACTSHAGKPDDPFIPTNQRSTKVFALADGHATPATTVAKLHHAVCEPARTVDIVPALKGNSLLSGRKFAKAGYISICDGKEVNIYDGRTAKITVSEEAVLKGWRCPHQNLWRVPLQSNHTTQPSRPVTNPGTPLTEVATGPSVGIEPLAVVSSSTPTPAFVSSSKVAECRCSRCRFCFRRLTRSWLRLFCCCW